jgi:hypothetical protein
MLHAKFAKINNRKERKPFDFAQGDFKILLIYIKHFFGSGSGGF